MTIPVRNVAIAVVGAVALAGALYWITTPRPPAEDAAGALSPCDGPQNREIARQPLAVAGLAMSERFIVWLSYNGTAAEWRAHDLDLGETFDVGIGDAFGPAPPLLAGGSFILAKPDGAEFVDMASRTRGPVPHAREGHPVAFDGRWVVYHEGVGGPIVAVDTQTGAERSIPGQRFEIPRVSGGRVLYETDDGERHAMRLLDLATGAEREVHQSPRLTPAGVPDLYRAEFDGRYAAFVSQQEFPRQVVKAIDVETGALRTYGGGQLLSAAVELGDGWLLYATGEIESGTGRWHVVDLAGNATRAFDPGSFGSRAATAGGRAVYTCEPIVRDWDGKAEVVHSLRLVTLRGP